MKAHWQKLALRIDAMSLRERAMIFAMSAVILVALVNATLLEPQYAKQKQLSQKRKQEQEQIAVIQSEIQQKRNAQQVDPDIANRNRLALLKQQSDQMHMQLLAMQKGLVSPDRMAVLLEDILKRNGKLKLISLKTLPASNLTDAPALDPKNPVEKTAVAAPKDSAQSKPVIDAVYKHGVEIVMQGGYLDIMNYMTELEAMPWQLFWGKATLNVEAYPKATLTLTLFTLSLDKKWLNL